MFTITDLFCGAGGTSTGAMDAARALGRAPSLTAINHWPVAIDTHTANHPDARHLCTGIDSVNPRDLYTEGALDLLWASPECTHHSNARGGRPRNDQSRSTAWCVTRWAEALRPPHIFVENVPEFLNWGPLGSNNKPLKSRKGEVFRSWCDTLRSLGYKVDHRLLCAADYGDATTRTRLFVQATRGRRKIIWPNPTHSEHGSSLFAHRPWRTARDIIDWSLPSTSIFSRPRPLAPKTIARIMAGLHKFGLNPTQPYIVAWDHQSGNGTWSADSPLSTVTTKARHGVAQPYLIELRGTKPYQISNSSFPADHPLRTITAGGGHLGLAQPYIISYYGNGGATSIDSPLPTCTTKGRFGLALPVITINGENYLLDIHFRMLQPHELAAAMGFPATYKFTGTKTHAVKQIGNAVPYHLARALAYAAINQNPDITPLWK